MVTLGTHTLAVQSGTAGFFACVSVRLEMVEGGDERLEIMQAPDLPSEWQTAAAFGIAYAREHLPRSQKFGRSFVVTVLEIRGHAVDTTLVAVAFAAAHAFWKAAGCQVPAGFDLDVPGRSFHLPK